MMTTKWAGWTDELIAEAKQLWSVGQSAGEIAKVFNTTRNTIMGKLNRLGFTGQTRANCVMAKDGRTMRPAAPKRPTKPRVVNLPNGPDPNARNYGRIYVVSDTPEHAADPVALENLKPCHCRWPLFSSNERPEVYMFCGEQKVEDSPYCERHRRMSVREKQTSPAKYIKGIDRLARFAASR